MTIPAPVDARLVLAADLHADVRWMPAAAVERVAAAIRVVDGADAVLWCGDFVAEDVTAVDWAAPIIGDTGGVPAFATLGNHDILEGAHHVTRALELAGIRVLVNEHAVIEERGLAILGIDSRWGGRPDVDAARGDLPTAMPKVVMGHEPSIALSHEELLHVAGHSHNGQVRPWPIGEFVARRVYPRFSQPYPSGLVRVRETPGQYVHTTAGIGYSSLPIRIGVPSEIVVIDLSVTAVAVH